ncbi:hypothetical protein FF1_024597 [Malus domestica]
MLQMPYKHPPSQRRSFRAASNVSGGEHYPCSVSRLQQEQCSMEIQQPVVLQATACSAASTRRSIRRPDLKWKEALR